MKVEFVYGTHTINGYECIRLGWNFLAGYYKDKNSLLFRKNQIKEL